MTTYIIAGLLSLTLFLGAQTSGDYFHSGAQYYIDSQLQQAIAAVTRGLEIEPQNPQLQALLEKLKEQQKQQQQNQDQQEQQDQEKEQQEQQDQEQQNQDQQDQEKEQQEQQNQQDQEKEQQEQQKEQQKQEQDQQESGQEEMPEPKAISKADAERILQAMRAKEKENQKLRLPRVKAKKKVEKDW